MPSRIQRATWTNNIRFIANPEKFMRSTIIDATRPLERSMMAVKFTPSALLANCKRVFQFDLEPAAYTKACLLMRSPKSPYNGGPAIRARFLGFNFKAHGAKQVAYIDATDAQTPIFTVGITGCTIIGMRSQARLRFYHEPTRTQRPTQWLGQYPGQMVIHAPATSGYGTAFMQPRGGKWQVVMQSFQYDQTAWIKSSSSGKTSADFFRFYSKPTVKVHSEASSMSVMRASALQRRAAMGYDDDDD